MSYSSQGERLAVGVRAHVLYSRLLSADDYWSLLSSDSMAEIARKLLATSYENTLETLPGEPHRLDIEAAIKRSLVDVAVSFVATLSGPRSKFFRALLRMHEADNLKSVFRQIVARRSNRDDLRKRAYISRLSSVSYEKLFAAHSFTDVMDALAGSIYEHVLEEPLRRLINGEEKSIFRLEMALDCHLEVLLANALGGLDARDRDMVMPIYGARADLFNLHILYRARRFYSMTPEETLNCLLPMRYRVPFTFLRAAVRADSVDTVLAQVRARFPQYADIFTVADSSYDSVMSVARNVRRCVYGKAARVFSMGPPNFHTAVSYFVMKEAEISDIVKMIEYVRYGEERRKAAEYLIRPILAGGGAQWP